MTGEDKRAAVGGASGPGAAGIVCHECGATGQVDLFCDSCGAVLRARTSEDVPAQRTSGSASEVAAVPDQPTGPGSASGSRSTFTPVPAAASAAPSLTETNGTGWDPVKEWSHILAPDADPAPDQLADVASSTPPGDAASAGSAESAGTSPDPAPAPRTRGPYEFTSRRPGAAGAAGVAGATSAATSEPVVSDGPAARPAPPEQQPGAAGILSSLESTVPVDSPAAAAPLAALAEDLGPSRSLDAPAPHEAADLSPTARTPQLPPSAQAAQPYSPPQPAQPSQSELQLRARELIIPVTDSAGVEQRIAPVPPGMPQPARPNVRTPEVHEVVGGVPCPWCSTPNPVDRHFCRRCAMSLAAGPGKVGRRPWWRRLLDWRRREVPYAGQRPRLRQGVGRLVRRIVLVALVVLVVVEIDLHAGTATTDVEDHFASPVQVYADSITASSQDPQHLAKLMADGFNNTYWGSDKQGDNTGVSIDAGFNQPIDLLDVIITPGATIEEDTFTTQSRPESLGVTLYKADGTSTQTTITFNDSVGPETFALRANDISKIQFTVKSIYQGNGAAADATELAITQIEFFARNASHS